MDFQTVNTAFDVTMNAISISTSYTDSLKNAPGIVKSARDILANTKIAMVTLERLVKSLAEQYTLQERATPADQIFMIYKLLKRTEDACNDLNNLLAECTKHSKNGRFSNWDRMVVYWDEHRFKPLIEQLRYCMSTMDLQMKTVQT